MHDTTNWTRLDYKILDEAEGENEQEIVELINKWIADGRPEIMDDKNDTFGIYLNLLSFYGEKEY